MILSAKDILALKFERNYEPPKEDGALMILCHEEMRLRRSINISRHARKKKMLTNFYAIQGQRRAVVKGGLGGLQPLRNFRMQKRKQKEKQTVS